MDTDSDSSNSSGDEDEEEEWRRRPAGIDTGNELIKLCQNLIFTYDISLMDKMSYALIDSFKREALKCTNGRPVLSRLITNYYNQKESFADPKQLKPVTKFIRGPKNLTVHWSKQFNKLIYIFGEYHQKPTCGSFTSSDPSYMMDIEDYIEQLLKNTDKFFDFAFEITAMGRKNLDYTYDPTFPFNGFALHNMLQRFRPCIATATRHYHECQLGRVHFLDIRTQNFFPIDNISFLMMSFVNAGVDVAKIGNTLDDPNFIKILTNLEATFRIDDDTRNTLSYFRVHVFSNIYNLTEMSRLEKSANKEDRSIAYNIRHFCSAEIQRLVQKYYQGLKTNVRDILKIYSETIYQGYATNLEGLSVIMKSNPDCIQKLIYNFVNLSNVFVHIVSISQDMYTLARLFKTFNLEKESFHGAIPNDQPLKAHNIIIYAGDSHSQRCRRFLNHLNFEEVGKTGQSENGRNGDSCIDMTNIRQPFFSGNSNIKKPVRKDYDYNYDHIYDNYNFL